MKKNKKAKEQVNERKLKRVSDDTLEFLSLDEETIEEYTRKTRPSRPKKKMPVRKTNLNLRRRDSYKEDDYEVEELEEIEDDEEYYGESDEDEDDEEYYGESDEDEDDEEYYGESDEEYYGESDEDEDDEEYYGESDEDEDDEEYYGESDEDEDDEEYYGESDEDEDDEEYYGESDDEDEDDEEYYGESDEEEDEDDVEYYEYYEEMDDDEIDDDEEEEDDDEEYENIFARFGHFISEMSSLDRVVALFGCAILIAAIATGIVYAGAKMTSRQVESFAALGAEIESIGVVGESGLLAVSNAEASRVSQMVDVENETGMGTDQETQVPETQTGSKMVEVGMNLTSIQADIKVKFVNKATNKLIGGVPFEVEISGDNGKNFNLKDEDKDGIIYQTGVAAGTYTIKVLPLQGGDNELYRLPSQADSLKVTDTITYKKVDVADEIKTESEVNVAIEDTAVQDTVVESVLKDTVEWVESTRTEQNADGNYQEIKKEDIPNPALIGAAGTFVKTVQGEETTGGQAVDGSRTEPGGDAGPGGGSGDGNSGGGSAGNEGGGGSGSAGGTGEGGPGNEGGENGSGSGGTGEGNTGSGSGTGGDNTTGSGSGTGSDNNTGTGGNTGSENPNPPVVTPDPPTPVQPTDREKLNTLNPRLSNLTMKKGESQTLALSVSSNDSYSVSWSNSNPSVVSVSGGGSSVTVKGESIGSATITATVSIGKETVNVSSTVNVTDIEYKSLTISGSGNIRVGKTGTLTGTTDPAGGTIAWTSDNAKVVTVDKNGVMTGVSVGTATITGTCGNAKSIWTVSVVAAEVEYKSLTVTGSGNIQVGKTGTVKGVTDPAGGVVTWTSDNEKIVKVDKDGVMTGVSAGTATITGVCGNVKGEWKVTVVKDLSNDTTTKLKDKNGNQVYVKNAEGKYIEATYADYYKDQKLYLRKAEGAYTYTGWQVIDGYTYFFDKNGQLVTGEQVIQGAKYSFGSDGRLSSGSGTFGIDVSRHNGNIDWNAVKNSGVSYVIIRCGYRGSTTGALIEDTKFASNIQGAKAAGLKVGVYFVTQAVNEVEAIEEASMAIKLVSGYGLNYPVFLDVEPSRGRGDKIDIGTRTAVCKAFCSTVQNSGYSAGIYANKTWFTTHINAGSLTGYKIWLAQYAEKPTYNLTRYDMWQYSSKGKVTGISGDVDLNISYMSY